MDGLLTDAESKSYNPTLKAKPTFVPWPLGHPTCLGRRSSQSIEVAILWYLTCSTQRCLGQLTLTENSRLHHLEPKATELLPARKRLTAVGRGSSAHEKRLGKRPALGGLYLAVFRSPEGFTFRGLVVFILFNSRTLGISSFMAQPLAKEL